MTRAYASRFDPSEAETLENRPSPFGAFRTFSAVSDWVHAHDDPEPITENGGRFEEEGESTARLPRARRRLPPRRASTRSLAADLPRLRPELELETDTHPMPTVDRTARAQPRKGSSILLLFALLAIFASAATTLNFYLR